VTQGQSVGARLLDRWQLFWWADIPPHIYALLRILFGFLGTTTLISLRDVEMFWSPNGFVPLDDHGLGLKAFVVAHGLQSVAGPVLYFACLGAFVAMMVGFRSGLAVTFALTASLVQLSWNDLPLSGAHAAVQAVLFCLIWADCGAVWSIDAWLAHPRAANGAARPPVSDVIAPLRLIRFQVALIYLNSGLWKLYNPYWRDGSAVHFVVNQNPFHRFPWMLPVDLQWLTTVASYFTLFWEIGFAFMLLFAPTRRLALIGGIVLHLGMMAFIEIGPFHWVMLATYVAFLDPEKVPHYAGVVFRRIRRSDVARINEAGAETLEPSTGERVAPQA
jgi:hypothetical protein